MLEQIGHVHYTSKKLSILGQHALLRIFLAQPLESNIGIHHNE